MRKSFQRSRQSQSGFTLIELLLVIAIIAILAAVIFVALDPLKRFKESRDSTRWSEVEEILHAIKIHQIDNKGEYIDSIQAIPNAEYWMIVDDDLETGSTTCNTGCTGFYINETATSSVASSTACIDLHDLVDLGYMPKVPISPHNPNNARWEKYRTGYVLRKEEEGYIEILACEPEGYDENNDRPDALVVIKAQR